MPPSAPNRGELSCLGRSARLFPCLFPKAPGKSSSHRKIPGHCQEKPRAQSSPFCKVWVVAKKKSWQTRAFFATASLRSTPGKRGTSAPRRKSSLLLSFKKEEKKKGRPQGAAVFFRFAVSQHTDTRPVWASRVTTAPLFKRSVACSAPVMTGLSMARPAIAAWELAPDSSVMMPEARRR